MPIRPVRRATPADTDALITLLDEARHEIGMDPHIDLYSPKYRALFESWCTGEGEVWLTTDKSGEMVILYQTLEEYKNGATVVLKKPIVQYIVVAANRRHQGVGRKLLKHAQILYSELEAEALSTNTNSQGLLSVCGFIHISSQIKKGSTWFTYHWRRSTC
jgi:GNAT superfamily N-acetyltransferase